MDEAGGVPDLIGEVAGGLHLFIHIAGIIAGAVAGHQHKAQGIRAVLVDDLQRVYAVAEGFAHLAALGIPHQAMNEDGIKGLFAGVFQTGEDHAGDPEGDDIVTGDEGGGGVEFAHLGSVIRPAQGGEGPQCAGEPGIQGIGVLGHVAAALGALFDALNGDNGLAAVIAVVGGDAVAPPQLAADAPVPDVLHPVEVVFIEALRNEADVFLTDSLDGGLCKGFHRDEPLLGDHGLDGAVAAVAGAYIVAQRLHRFEGAAGFQVLKDGLAGLPGGHAGVLAAVQHLRLAGGSLAGAEQLIGGGFIGGTGHAAIVGEYTDTGQIMALAYLEVIGVVGGGDLYDTGALFHIGVLIADDGDFLIQQRQDDMAAVQVGVAGILAIDGHGGITQHGFGTGGGQLQLLAGLLDGVEQMPEAAVLLLVFYLGIADGGIAGGAPVDHAVAAVDEALIVQALKHQLHRTGAALIEGEALPLPVAAGAELFELADDAPAVLAAPFPGALQKALAADFFLGDAFLAHGFHDLGLGGDGGVIGAGQPQGLVALHAAPADQRVLKSIIQRVPHMQLAGDIGGRNDDGVGFLFAFGIGVEVVFIQPELVGAVFDLLGVIDLFQLFCHGDPPFFFWGGTADDWQ